MKTPTLRAPNPKTVKMALGALAGVLILAGAGLAWSGWQQRQAESTIQAVGAAEQALTAAGQKHISTLVKAAETQAASNAVQAAAVRGDWAGASQALAGAWKGAKQAQVLASDLTASYDAPKVSYTRLALMEAVLRDGKGRVAAVLDGSTLALGVAAPVVTNGRTVGVAYSEQPAKLLVDAVKQAQIDGEGYVGVRQGDFTLAEQGDTSLASSLSAQATPIKQSSLSVVSVAPEAPGGMGGMMALIIGGVLVLLGAVLGVVARAMGARVVVPAAVEEERVVGLVPAQMRVERPAPVVAAEEPAIEAEAPQETAALFPGGVQAGAIEAGLEIELARELGQRLGTALAQREVGAVVVGRDARDSSRVLMTGLVEGLVASGRRVHELGHAPAPMVVFAGGHLGAGASISVMGDLRSITHTGLQVSVGGMLLDQEALNAMTGTSPQTVAGGAQEAADVSAPYLDQVAETGELPRRVHVGVSGEHSELLARALQRHGVVVDDVPGAELELMLTDNGSGLSVCDKNSQPISAARVLLALASDLLDRAPGADIVCDAGTAEALASPVLAKGGIVKVAGPDLADLQAHLVERAATLGGDALGHVFVVDRGQSVPDGVLAGLRLVEILGFYDHADAVFSEE